MSRAIRLSLVLLAGSGVLAAQQQHSQPVAAKPTLGSADYAKWETLGAGVLSPDGKWVAYDFRRGNGSSELRYRAVGVELEAAVRFATNPQFTSNSRWLLYTVLPDTAGGAGRGGRGAAAGRGGGGGGGGAARGATPALPPNRNKVAAVDLQSGATATFDDVQSYSLSSDGSHVALRRYATQGHRGADVIVRDLDAGTELSFGNVAESSWNDDGSQLAMIIDVEGKTGNGVQLLDTHTGAIRSLDASTNQYSGLAWRAKSNDLAAMRSRVDSAFVDTSYAVLAWKNPAQQQAKTVYDFSTDGSFPAGLRVASYRAPEWSEDGSTLFFGAALREPKVTPERRAPGEPAPARVQVWHWKDLRQFHQQQVQSAQDRQRTTPLAWHVGSTSAVRLSDDPYEQVQLADNETVAIAYDETPYVREVMSGRAVRDAYTVDPSTGKRAKILTKSAFTVTLSPSGRHALYQEGTHWWSLDIATGARANLTGKIKSVFVNAEDDHPVPQRRAYGVAGFTTGEQSAIVYDRFDLWQVNLDGSNPVRLTRGKEDSTVYRCASEGGGGGRGGRGGRGGFGGGARSAPCSLDGEGRAIDTSKPLMLTATGEYNKKSGYATLTVGQPAQRLVWLDKSVTNLRKAEHADVYLFEQQTYSESPNYYVAGPTLRDAKAVSHTNAFQGEYAWGKQELMDYTNKRGDKLQMMLTYPADYQPGRKYPMVVYYYEKLSQGFHQYVVPSDRATYNTSVFSQNGYFVLRPDILFQARNAGYSGLDCVTSAVRTVEGRVADIDPKRVGNMGHSWGGYQSAFYAVHNPGIFAATIAGAPLTDLISFYGYTSGNSGLAETGHFETGQERMGVSLWEDPQAYIRNSTVFAMDSLKTPLLLEEGDADGNVNPFQSEEVYNFGRRLGKNVVYLVYEQENHGVARPESQMDYARRQLEWFGHYLKGDPAQTWITEGESYQARQRILKAGAAGPGRVTPTQAGGPTTPGGAPRK
jgi:dipeptidyl aminopeptidase/acylaminoacyl peptidase